MKNTLKIITLIVATFFVAVSCDYDETNYDMLTKAPDASDGYYLQFENSQLNTQVGIDTLGNPIEVKSTILVTLMGLPQTEDITGTISHNAASTMSTDMYTLSTNSFTIPAGETSASIDFSTIAEEMPECESVNLILDLNAGETITPSDNGSKVDYTIRKISPTPLENGVSDLAGSWGIAESFTDGEYFDEGNFSATWDGTNLISSGFGQGMIVGFWSETVVDSRTYKMTVTEDGTVTIPRQYVFTTVYEDVNYDYEIEGSGTWVSLCGEAPEMKIQYDIYYAGEDVGLAEQYGPGYLGGSSYLGGVFKLN